MKNPIQNKAYACTCACNLLLLEGKCMEMIHVKSPCN